MVSRSLRAPLVCALLITAGCDAGGSANAISAQSPGPAAATAQRSVPLTITTASGAHRFDAEPARTRAEQDRGLMYRTDLGPKSAMLFYPYPAEGGGPKEASFWMKNTPTPLDIIFIRADGTIASIAENTVPFSEAPVPSGEPVGAVLELVGGRAAELGISPGDKVSWAGFPAG
ncbi:DUF192 domain-containing protein [Sphingomonas sp. S1-29]|uniref:DUF192 domain-containing protein n=1 Tax=Sphingomonas sp. S1-29 TaxID=2991074 RepID=UPI00223EA893|nr:DUF192 domain-containing protein [Sphingomonas sp. S1-29]UZK69363.1 DUF192 domain-containing protein [Sphingomonas sp. S1-29]